MEVNGQPHTRTVLPPRKEPLVAIALRGREENNSQPLPGFEPP